MRLIGCLDEGMSKSSLLEYRRFAVRPLTLTLRICKPHLRSKLRLHFAEWLSCPEPGPGGMTGLFVWGPESQNTFCRGSDQ